MSFPQIISLNEYLLQNNIKNKENTLIEYNDFLTKINNIKSMYFFNKKYSLKDQIKIMLIEISFFIDIFGSEVDSKFVIVTMLKNNIYSKKTKSIFKDFIPCLKFNENYNILQIMNKWENLFTKEIFKDILDLQSKEKRINIFKNFKLLKNELI
jgi:hypothetical protein